MGRGGRLANRGRRGTEHRCAAQKNRHAGFLHWFLSNTFFPSHVGIHPAFQCMPIVRRGSGSAGAGPQLQLEKGKRGPVRLHTLGNHLLARRGLMIRFSSTVLSMFIVCSSSLQSSAQSSDLDARRARFREAIAAQWQYELKTHPELATFIGDPRYNDRLSDDSPRAMAAEGEENERQLALFEAIDSTGFSPEELLNKKLMIRNLRQAIEDTALKTWEMPVTQMGGIHLDVALMPSQMPFNSVQDYENYIVRLRAVPTAFGQIIEVMRLGLHDRLMPPKYLLEK